MSKTDFRCPTCGSLFDPEHSTAMPFCRERCRQIDLGRWLDEKQSLPALTDAEDDLCDEDTGQ